MRVIHLCSACFSVMARARLSGQWEGLRLRVELGVVSADRPPQLDASRFASAQSHRGTASATTAYATGLA